MANVFFLVAVSLLSGMPQHTNAFKYGKLPSYPLTYLMCIPHVKLGFQEDNCPFF